MIRCEVVQAWPGAAWSLELSLPEGATVADALRAARAESLADAVDRSGERQIDWNARVGIFGEVCSPERRLEDGDRIELYRPLAVDPKESRRARAQRSQRARRQR
ncbi:MAG: RnfH family protein [Steroidobacteraceae bacterium]